MDLSFINLPKAFLSGYDTCLNNASPDYCRGQITSSAPTMIDVYLKTYENCRNLLGSEKCKSLMAPEPASGIVSSIPILALGIIAGAIIFGKRRV
jgi:hypothetical protein